MSLRSLLFLFLLSPLVVSALGPFSSNFPTQVLSLLNTPIPLANPLYYDLRMCEALGGKCQRTSVNRAEVIATIAQLFTSIDIWGNYDAPHVGDALTAQIRALMKQGKIDGHVFCSAGRLSCGKNIGSMSTAIAEYFTNMATLATTDA